MADPKDTGTTMAIGWLLMGLIFFALAMLVWYFNKHDILNIIRWVRWGELQVLAPFISDESVVLTTKNGATVTYDMFQSQLGELPKNRLNTQIIGLASDIAMRPMLPLFSALGVLMALWCMFYGPGTHYRRKFDLSGLIRAQSRTFPYVTPLIDFDPGKQPPRPPGTPVPADLPPFAEALAPEEWIAYNTIPTLTEREIDKQAAAQGFAKQLGNPWRGWNHLSPYRQVLLAAFCLKAARKRKESDVMLGDLAQCWVRGKLQITGKLLRQARSTLNSRELSAATLAKCNLHAFETTALLRALLTARDEGGVLAPATFVWLRAYDRALWYPLNNLGRQAFHMEALGAMCHFKAEKLIGRPIVRPKVEGAVESLVAYLKSYKARPIPELDYSRSKSRGLKKIAAS